MVLVHMHVQWHQAAGMFCMFNTNYANVNYCTCNLFCKHLKVAWSRLAKDLTCP